MKFFVGVSSFRLYMGNCRSLKDKRQITRSMLERIGNRRAMGVSEVEGQDSWKSAVLAVSCVSGSYEGAEEGISRARRLIESYDVEVVEQETWVYSSEDLRG